MTAADYLEILFPQFVDDVKKRLLPQVPTLKGGGQLREKESRAHVFVLPL